MILTNRFTTTVAAACLAAASTATTGVSQAFAAGEEPTVAFPDKWMIRAGAYIVDQSKTQVSVNSDIGGIGTTIDYQRDLGGEDGDTIPRVDAYYRFNDRHRIDFTSFSISRKGERTLAIDIDLGDQNFFINETLQSEIDYTLYRLGYGYSFYHSPKAELTFTVGLNLTEYDLKFALDDGTKSESAGVTVPLPVVGLRMGYLITPKWMVRYVSEAFFISIEDAFRGAIINFEISTEYRLFKNFALGVGLARIGINAEVNDDKWRGQVTDSYRGYTVYGTLYF